MHKNSLELELTNICNARCIMCPAIHMQRNKGFMSQETFEMIIQKGMDYGIERIRFCGLGEPLLHKDFQYFFSYVKANTPYITELITNGSLLDEEIVHCLTAHRIDFLSISFPSLIKDNYEKIMKQLVFEEVLERVLHAVYELKNHASTHITVTGVVTGINNDEQENITRFWTQHGVDCIELYTPHNRGGHLKGTNGLNIASPFEHPSGSTGIKSLCPWPLRQFFIGWDGSVLLCCCDMEGENTIGTIVLDDFSLMERVQESICLAQPELCKRCSYQGAKIIIRKDNSR